MISFNARSVAGGRDTIGRAEMKTNRLALAALLLPLSLGAQEGPPKEAGKRAPDLVDLAAIDPTIRLEIRYATAENEFGRPFYKQARAFLQRPAAEALARVNAALKEKGYALLVFDGYRPWRVTKQFWDLTPADKKIFVANPKDGSRHNRGGAVDLTLYDLRTGREADMGGAYDEMSPRSYVTYEGAPKEALERRDLLRKSMEKEGFFIYPWEWWHFDWKDWRDYPILDVPFSAIGTSHRAAPPRPAGTPGPSPTALHLSP
jgi:D-alanyl-D-alanine dipeptidase